MTGRVFRVLVLDDHRAFAEALADLLDAETDLVAEAGTPGPGNTLPAATAEQVDVLLLAGSAVQLVPDALATDPGLGVICIGDGEDPGLLAASIRAGAKGWLTKTTPASESVAAVRAVAHGELRIPSGLVTNAFQAARRLSAGDDTEEVTGLTPREEAVLQCLADGMTRGQAALALGISVNTLRTHAQNILVKLGVRSALAAVAKARHCGLVT